MPKKLGITDFVSEIKRVENYPDFEKSVFHNDVPGFIVKNIDSQSTEAWQTILAIFCRSGSVA